MLSSSYRFLKFKASLISLTILLLMTFYVLTGRTALVYLPHYQADIERFLTEQINSTVTINSLSGHWIGFDPVIQVDGLSINGAENVYVGRARFRLAFLASIFDLAPRFKSISIEHLEVNLFQNDDGAWVVEGMDMFEYEGATAPETDDAQHTELSSFFNGTTITILDNTVSLHGKSGVVDALRFPVLSLNYRDDHVLASGKVMQKEGGQTLLNFALEGQGVLTDKPVWGTLYIEARSSEFFDRVLRTYQWENVSIQDIDASMRLWLSFEGFNVKSLQGDAQVRQINWKAAEKSLPPILNAAMGFQLAVMEEQSELLVSDLDFSWAGESCHSSDIRIVRQALQTEINASYLDVSCASRIAQASNVLQAPLQDRLDASDPGGLLKNIRLVIHNQPDQSDDDLVKPTEDIERKKPGDLTKTVTNSSSFDFEAELADLSLGAYSGAPSGRGIDGYITADADGGSVYFDSEHFELAFPDLFDSPWKMKRSEGAVSWLLKGNEIEVFSEGLRLLQQDDSLVYGDFLLRLNPPEKEDYLSLSLAMQDIPFTNATDFVPVHIVGEDLNSWLEKSLISGTVSEGIYVGYGSIESDAPENSFTSSILLKSHQGELNFAEGWPNLEELEADINLQNGRLDISAQKAKIKNTALLDLNAILPESKKDESGLLSVTANIKAGETELDFWLKESPVSEHTRTIAEQLEVDGIIDVALGLKIPLSADDEIQYEIRNTLNSLDVKHVPSDLNFKGAQGVFVVSSEDGFTAENIQTEFLKQQAKLSIATHTETVEKKVSKAIAPNTVPDDDKSRIVISIDSGVRVEELLDYFKQSEIKGLKGGFNYHAELSLPDQPDEYPVLTVATSLEGLAHEWPAPFYKDFTENSSLNLSLLIKPDQMYLNLNAKSDRMPVVESELLFVGSAFTFGEVLIGGASSQNPDITGLNIRAKLDHLELEPWLDFLHTQAEESEPASQDSESGILKKVDLELGHLAAYGQDFEATEILFTKPVDSWQVSLSGESISGQITLPSENSILDIQLDTVSLMSDPDAGDESESPAGSFDSRQLPEMKVSVQNLLFNGQHYGAWQTYLEPNQEGSVFRDIKGKLTGADISGQLNWKYSDPQTYSSILLLDIQGAKIEEFMAAIGQPELITSKKYDATMALVWADDPFDFELSKVSGSLNLTMEDGFLKTEDNKTGALRLFGVLNAESIMRRLKLDFSDLYKSGVSYDSLSVGAKINQGLLTFSEPLLIDGPSSSYVVNGSADLKNRVLDMDMLVKFPFMQNVPLAALILGAPQIGGAVWVVDKLLGEPLSAITTARYDITGSFDDPKVDLHQAVNASKKDRTQEKLSQ